MFWRSDKGKGGTDKQTENRIEPEQIENIQELPPDVQETEPERPLTREELLMQNEEARKMYENIMNLRKSVEGLKDQTANVPAPKAEHKQASHEAVDRAGKSLIEESEEVRAAHQAIIERAQRDLEEQRLKEEESRRRELMIKQEHERALEAQRKAALIEEEAERRRRDAALAEKKAKEVARKKALEIMAAERKARELKEREADALKHSSATPEEAAQFFNGSETEDVKNLEELKEQLLSTQEKQEQVLNKISEIAGQHTEKLAEAQSTKAQEVAEAHKRALQEQEERLKLQELRVIQEKTRAEQIALKKAEEQAEKKRSAAEKALKKQQHKAKVRAERLTKVQKKREERALKADEKERIKQEKRRLAKEKARLKKQAEKDAELGGGIVTVKGVTINTEINKNPHFLWRDFFGFFGKKEEKQVQSEEEKQRILEEREIRKEEARARAEILAKKRRENYEKSAVGRRMLMIRTFCDENKKKLLVAFSAVLTFAVGVAGVFNYCTAYEYSYNGQVLGIVKEKDEVLRITDMVQGALTEDRNVNVVIDAKDDISFERVMALGNVKIDSSEEVLKRLTYMGDLNVKAYGIYVDGKKIGAVEDKKAAANVMKEIKERYTGKYENSELEEAVFIESVEVKKSNTDLEDVRSEKEMVDLMCTSGQKETLHKVVAGETLADIAKLYSISEEEILAENDGIDQKKLSVGSTIVIKQEAPLVTVKTTELVTYDKVIEHKVEKQNDSSIYEGYTQTQQKGEDGLSEITARITSVNGEAIDEENLVTTVKKDPVTEVILVGTKERPPTVGSGKYIWPLKGSVRLTSGFGSRWGSFHKGQDMACNVGTSVYAADGGTVIEAGYNGSYGNTILIDHQNGMTTRYAHCSKLLVKKGDKVFQGQEIAKSGNTGRSTGPHLHFEIRVNDVPKNPLNYLP